uniref:Ig-like domain-containing protein n=1 Tax=Graphocephala atropunctata TaxID=36148 RepID=A0A1B6KMV3_9HEMI
MVAGLRLTELVGPRYPDRGENVKLTCNFDTDDANLYSVKWYKDENEFFRYMPDNRPQIQVFPLTGVMLDESLSGMNHVMLRDVAFPSSGSYRCEVSMEAPSFETVFSNHNMTVLSYPQEEPTLSGVQEIYSAGDLVSVNCTAPASHPAPDILFYTNNDKAEDWLIERGPVVVHEDGTFSTSAILRFHAERQHFQQPDDMLELKCEVVAPPLPPLAVSRYVYLAGPTTNQKLAQQNYRNHGASANIISLPLIMLLLFLL